MFLVCACCAFYTGVTEALTGLEYDVRHHEAGLGD